MEQDRHDRLDRKEIDQLRHRYWDHRDPLDVSGLSDADLDLVMEPPLHEALRGVRRSLRKITTVLPEQFF